MNKSILKNMRLRENHMFKQILLTLVSIHSVVAIDLNHFEKKIFSQNGEDGVLEKIFSVIGTTNSYYVEFGVENGAECNTRYLREKYGWNGLLMDGGYENKKINLRREFITAENINQLFSKYQVPKEFDLLSIDIDYNDFYIWQALGSEYRPRAVVIEYNPTHLPSEDKVVLYDAKGKWDGTNYYGASMLALYKLGRKKGYSLVHADAKAVNLFFIRNDIIANLGETFENINSPVKLYKRPKYGKGRGPNGGHRKDRKRRKYISSGIEIDDYS
jgi:hypothetical protein